MIFGKQSDVKKHLSSKHATFPHRLFVDDAAHEITGEVQAKEESAEQTPQPEVEKPEDTPSKS
jgi:hypothetical protein